MSDAVKRVLGGMTAEGWAKFSNIGKSFEEQQSKQREEVLREASIVWDTFRTPVGEKCLDMLVEQVLLHNQLRPFQERLSIEEQALYAARREGQNSVIALILNAIAIARGGEPAIKTGGEGT